MPNETTVFETWLSVIGLSVSKLILRSVSKERASGNLCKCDICLSSYWRDTHTSGNN